MPHQSIESPADGDAASRVEPARRRFLRSGGALIGAVVSASDVLAQPAATADPPAVPDSMKTPGAPVGAHLYGEPSSFEAGVVRNVPPGLLQYLSASSRSPLQELDGIITPNGLFYERHHAGVPSINPPQDFRLDRDYEESRIHSHRDRASLARPR